MKTVVSPSQVCHLFANGAQSRARSGSCSFEETTSSAFPGAKCHVFRSYSTQIAVRVEQAGRKPFILMTEHDYSVTTKGQKQDIRNAARHIDVAYATPESRTGYSYLLDLLNEETLYHTWLDELIELEAAIGEEGNRKAGKNALAFQRRLEQAQTCYRIVTGETFIYPMKTEVFTELNVLLVKARAEHANRSQASRRMAAGRTNFFGRECRWRTPRDALIVHEQAERLTQWRAGEKVNPYAGMPMSLRVQGDEVVTSEGARVPLRLAIAFYRRLLANEIMTGQHVGAFELSGADNENVVIGCHTIPRAEMARLWDTLTPELTAA
jgi:hypothetical protein